MAGGIDQRLLQLPHLANHPWVVVRLAAEEPEGFTGLNSVQDAELVRLAVGYAATAPNARNLRMEIRRGVGARTNMQAAYMALYEGRVDIEPLRADEHVHPRISTMQVLCLAALGFKQWESAELLGIDESRVETLHSKMRTDCKVKNIEGGGYKLFQSRIWTPVFVD